jgi:hypothetical protein
MDVSEFTARRQTLTGGDQGRTGDLPDVLARVAEPR